MRSGRFEWSVAIRFFREGRLQSALIVAGAVVGIGVMVFLTALINGLQSSLIAQTLATQAHVVVLEPDRQVRPIEPHDGFSSSSIQQPGPRLRSISNWQRLDQPIRQVAGVTGVAPLVSGPALASRGEALRAIQLQGVVPESFDEVISVSTKMVDGALELDGDQVVVGVGLAEELGLARNDRIRIEVSPQRTGVFTVTGIFDLGSDSVNSSWVLISLRQAQSLLDLVGGVSTFLVSVDDVFQASAIAREVEARTDLEAKSWMETNEQLLVALRSQSSSSAMISFFVVVAVALGIASVLSVSVVQKSREIGILKAMGARTRQVIRIFLIQGLLVGASGAIGGSLLGVGLALFFQNLARDADGSARFPVDLGPSVWLTAAAVSLVTGLVAAAVPARRAARLDPAVVIRNG